MTELQLLSLCFAAGHSHCTSLLWHSWDFRRVGSQHLQDGAERAFRSLCQAFGLDLRKHFFTKRVLKHWHRPWHWHRFPGEVSDAQAWGYRAKGTRILAGGGVCELEQKLSSRAVFGARSSRKLSPELHCPSSALQQCPWVALPSQTLSLPPKQSHKELMQTNFPITRASPARRGSSPESCQAELCSDTSLPHHQSPHSRGCTHRTDPPRTPTVRPGQAGDRGTGRRKT